MYYIFFIKSTVLHKLLLYVVAICKLSQSKVSPKYWHKTIIIKQKNLSYWINHIETFFTLKYCMLIQLKCC